MKHESSVILGILKTIERVFPETIAFAYSERNSDGNHLWWTICISDYIRYGSKEFKDRCKVWYAMAKKMGMKIVFAYCKPLEYVLVRKSEENNLILNV